MTASTGLEATLRHDRAIVLAALTGVAAVAWLYMWHEARRMDETGVCCCIGMAMSGPDVQPWSASSILPLFAMWAEMMVAMMLPSAAPTILTFALVNRKRREQERPYVPTGLFAMGYFLVWTVFSLAAAGLQWLLHGVALISPMMKSTSPVFAGVLLIGAGIFQWSPAKHACLQHCRSPLQFLLGSWQEGRTGALWMGVKHGAYCTVCCWMLMVILFVAGVMNMVWVAAITLLVMLEKLSPTSWRADRMAGVVLIAWGAWMLLRPTG
jgi:predicted metal-binding membrane protein